MATVVGLALDSAHVRELATQRAAHGSAVQIASEALGTILGERELYRTVLVLTLEYSKPQAGLSWSVATMSRASGSKAPRRRS